MAQKDMKILKKTVPAWSNKYPTCNANRQGTESQTSIRHIKSLNRKMNRSLITLAMVQISDRFQALHVLQRGHIK